MRRYGPEEQQMFNLTALSAEGGDEQTGFLRALTVFCWVPFSCGCILNKFVYPGCVSVLLHLLLQTFLWLCLLSRCYMVLLGCCYMLVKWCFPHTMVVPFVKTVFDRK